jgi:hypothetical protein
MRNLFKKQRAEVAEILNVHKFSDLHFISQLVQMELKWKHNLGHWNVSQKASRELYSYISSQ